MSTDLVSRLRDGQNEQHWVLRVDAAEEIERLREEVAKYKAWSQSCDPSPAVQAAIAEIESLTGDETRSAIKWVREHCLGLLRGQLKPMESETPTCPPELMGPRPLTGVYCEDEEREDLEAAWLEEHPPGSACTNGCGYCGRCT